MTTKRAREKIILFKRFSILNEAIQLFSDYDLCNEKKLLLKERKHFTYSGANLREGVGLEGEIK